MGQDTSKWHVKHTHEKHAAMLIEPKHFCTTYMYLNINIYLRVHFCGCMKLNVMCIYYLDAHKVFQNSYMSTFQAYTINCNFNLLSAEFSETKIFLIPKIVFLWYLVEKSVTCTLKQILQVYFKGINIYQHVTNKMKGRCFFICSLFFSSHHPSLFPCLGDYHAMTFSLWLLHLELTLFWWVAVTHYHYLKQKIVLQMICIGTWKVQ